MENIKYYPFSMSKQIADIDYYRNHLLETMRRMDDGDIPMDIERYDRIHDMLHGDLEDLYEMLEKCRGEKTAYITEGQYELAQKIVKWASSRRIQNNRNEGEQS